MKESSSRSAQLHGWGCTSVDPSRVMFWAYRFGPQRPTITICVWMLARSAVKKVDMWHAPKGRTTFFFFFSFLFFFQNAFGNWFWRLIKKQETWDILYLQSHSGYILEGILEPQQSYFFLFVSLQTTLRYLMCWSYSCKNLEGHLWREVSHYSGSERGTLGQHRPQNWKQNWESSTEMLCLFIAIFHSHICMV